MKRNILFSAIPFFFALTVYSADTFRDPDQLSATWRAGVARTVITPEKSMWMAGYAARDHQSEGTIHDLWAKALALEDADGKRAILITTDLLGFPKGLSDRIRNRLEDEYKLSRAQIILHSTHTHSGPVLKDALYDIYPLNQEQIIAIEQYSDRLAEQIIALAGKALRSMEPVEIYAQNGVTRFQVNRRNNDASTLHMQSELKGPGDHAVPVLKIVDRKGDLMAVAFGYACHPTVLDQYEWSGDYPGFAQIELEKTYPGATALFFMGAGADQNPLPRLTVGLARQYGKELAAAVERVLEEEMRKLPPQLSLSYSEIPLPLNPPPTKEELLVMAHDTSSYASYQKRWAGNMIARMEKNDPFMSSYPYPLQVWQIGGQMLVSMGGEVVVAYANSLKRIYGPDIFVMGYSNDVMSYIPSVTILEEGGYEGYVAQQVYGLPNTWKPAIESMIIQEIIRLAGQAGIPQTGRQISSPAPLSFTREAHAE
jgi:hypothetical protein